MKRLFLRSFLGCALSGALFGTALITAGAHAEDTALRAAVADAQRTPANVLRDPARHPYETLAFFGISPTMQVVELAPGGGWYTEILAPYLREHGQLIAAGDDPQSKDADERNSALRMAKKFGSAPQRFGKVKIAVFSPPDNLAFAAPASVDMVLTFRNVHNWVDAVGDTGVKRIFAAVYASLKPGGVFGVVEHRLPEDRAQDPKASTGYVHASYVKAMAQQAGFTLAAESQVNANPKDNADHPGGVWALPPTYQNGATDRAGYAAIGESDRMTLRFVKPH